MKKRTIDKKSSERQPVDKPPAKVSLQSSFTQKHRPNSSPMTSKNVSTTVVVKKENPPSGPKVKQNAVAINKNKPAVNQDMVSELQRNALFRRRDAEDDRKVIQRQ